MEFIDGNPLRADIQRFGSDFLVDKAVEIAISVTSALSVAHQWEGAIVVHRDVKPENIMLDDNGRIVLLDFGFARLLERTGFAQTATPVGTPRYMSPEQFDRRADPKCDIWAVGVVLYEMLSGSAPFAGSDDGEIEHAVRYEQFRPLTDYRDDIPPEIVGIIRRTLEKDPVQRYQDTTELLETLVSVREQISTGTAAHSSPVFFDGSALVSVVIPRTDSDGLHAQQVFEDYLERRGVVSSSAAVCHLIEGAAKLLYELATKRAVLSKNISLDAQLLQHFSGTLRHLKANLVQEAASGR